MDSTAQRLNQLENSAAKLAELRTRLTENAEKVYREIGRTAGEQISLVKGRELMLADVLRRIHDQKEARILAKQRRVYEAIGACKQAIQAGCAATAVGELEVELDEEKTEIDFKFDLLSIRSAISHFGEITANKAPQRTAAGSSLPKDFEMYDEEDLWLAKKWSGNVKSSSGVSTPVDDVKDWISRLPEHPANKDMAVLVSELEANSMIESETASSFDIVPPTVVEVKATKPGDVISKKFLENLSRPMTDWLCKVSAAAKTAPETDFKPYSASQCGSAPSSSTAVEADKRHEFVNVINSVQNSDNDKWVSRKRQHEDEDTESSSPKEWGMVEAAEVESFLEDSFINHLVLMFGRSMSAVANNQEVDLDDVNAWRNLVGQMQSSKQWIKD